MTLEGEMISRDHNYGHGYIVLAGLNILGLPKRVEVNGLELVRKPEFHITLVAAKKLAAWTVGLSVEIIEAGIVDYFKDFIKDKPLNEFSFTGELRLASKRDKKSLIAMANVPGLDEFFGELSEKLEIPLPLQPAHITLYTLQPNEAISFFSYQEVQEISETVNVPGLGASIARNKNF